MYTETGCPFTGKMQEKLQNLLLACRLSYDPSIEFTVAIMEEDEMIAAGSLSGDTVRYTLNLARQEGSSAMAAKPVRISRMAASPKTSVMGVASGDR